jgi:hypothetical protein
MILSIACLVGALVALRAYWRYQLAQRIKISSPVAIESLEKVRLGGVDQWILIRGWNRENPVLLLMHGGPEFPCMPTGARMCANQHDLTRIGKVISSRSRLK